MLAGRLTFPVDYDFPPSKEIVNIQHTITGNLGIYNIGRKEIAIYCIIDNWFPPVGNGYDYNRERYCVLA